MRIVTTRNDAAIQQLSYEDLASGITSGVWSEEDKSEELKKAEGSFASPLHSKNSQLQ